MKQVIRILTFCSGLGVVAWIAAQSPTSSVARTSPSKEVVEKMFLPFGDTVKSKTEGDQIVLESDGLPNHPMMVGITAWQQQVPLPQGFKGTNSFRITLNPTPARDPLMFGNIPLMNAVAVAANGVPIFPGLNNRGEDSNAIGELDKFGGHCGRADDYHYHTAPLHLSEKAGKDLPVALAFDGYPIFWLRDPDGSEPGDLDKFGGHASKLGYYHYHAKDNLPYINGGFYGKVTIANNQVEPQPRTTPIREAGSPLRGATITGYERLGMNGNRVTFKYQNQDWKVESKWTEGGAVTMAYVSPDGKRDERTFQRRPRRRE